MQLIFKSVLEDNIHRYLLCNLYANDVHLLAIRSDRQM